MAYLIFLSLLECVCLGGGGIWYFLWVCVVCLWYVCSVCVWCVYMVWGVCVFGVRIRCGVYMVCVCLGTWGQRSGELRFCSFPPSFLRTFQVLTQTPEGRWARHTWSVSETASPTQHLFPGLPLPPQLAFWSHPHSTNCSHLPTQHSWLSSNWPDFLNSFILLTFSSTFLAKILWHNLHRNASKAATSFSSLLVHRKPWIREGRVRVPLGRGQRQGRLQIRVTRAVPGAACGYCSPVGSEHRPALSGRKQRGMQKLWRLLREKSILACIAPLQLHPSMFSATWLPSWWLLRGGFLPTLTLLCILHPGGSTIWGSLRELIYSVHCTSTADYHTGRAISKSVH